MKKIIGVLFLMMLSAAASAQLLPKPICDDKPWCYVGNINAGDRIHFNEYIDYTNPTQPQTWWKFEPPVPRYLEGELFDEMLILIRAYCQDRQIEVLAIGINLDAKSVGYAILSDSEREIRNAPSSGIGALQVDIPCATVEAWDR